LAGLGVLSLFLMLFLVQELLRERWGR